MNKRQRQKRRAVANGQVCTPLRKTAMPSPKVYKLKTDYKRIKRFWVEEE